MLCVDKLFIFNVEGGGMYNYYCSSKGQAVV
jgi:hypothetical protein